jgi:CSLREA domain-containing protein
LERLLRTTNTNANAYTHTYANSRTLSGAGWFHINDNGDATDLAPGDGVCRTAGGVCTLRAAIQEANALAACGSMNIELGNITSFITLGTALPDINSNVNIKGPVNSSLLIQRSTAPGTADFRIFTINSGKVVSISGVTISTGLVPGGNGGGVLNNGGSLTLTNCDVYGNSVGSQSGFGQGGGIFSSGPLVLNNCRIGGAQPGQPNTSGANGGGITSLSTLSMNGGSVIGNSQSGIYISGGVATLTGVAVTNKHRRRRSERWQHEHDHYWLLDRQQHIQLWRSGHLQRPGYCYR